MAHLALNVSATRQGSSKQILASPWLHREIFVMPKSANHEIETSIGNNTTALFFKHTGSISLARYCINLFLFADTFKKFDQFVGNGTKTCTFLLLRIPLFALAQFPMLLSIRLVLQLSRYVRYLLAAALSGCWDVQS